MWIAVRVSLLLGKLLLSVAGLLLALVAFVLTPVVWMWMVLPAVLTDRLPELLWLRGVVHGEYSLREVVQQFPAYLPQFGESVAVAWMLLGFLGITALGLGLFCLPFLPRGCRHAD